MIKKITITEDILKLIPFLNVYEDEEDDTKIIIDKVVIFNLGSHLMEDMANILGLSDKALEWTKNDAEGRAYDDETEKYMLETYEYIKDNLIYIESIIHQFAPIGGVKVGTYSCDLKDMIWEYRE